MAWRRKRKADEKGPPKKGRAKEKVPAEGGTQKRIEADATVLDEHDEAVPATEGGAFFGCYLLSSINPKRKGATYIGPVEMVLVVYGFRTMVHALQFEWAWQHPNVSLAVKEAAAGIKNQGGVKGKIALLYAMLNLPKWKKLPLVLQFVSGRHIKHKLGLPPLPGHMDCILAPLSNLRCKVDDAAEDAPIQDEPTAAEAHVLAEDSGGSDPPGNGVSEGPSQTLPVVVPPRESASGGPADGPSDSTWADPLSDWDWLARDREAELEKEDSQEMESTDPFATWQRLKAPNPVGKKACGGSRTSASDGSRDTQGGPSKEGERLGKIGIPHVGRDWGNDRLDAPDEAERSECWGSIGEQESGWDGAGETGVVSGADAVLRGSEPFQERGSRETGQRDEALRSTLGESGKKETIDLVEEEDSDAGTPGISAKSSEPGHGSHEDQLRRVARKATPSLWGVELVVLEDSPLVQKPRAGKGRGFASNVLHTLPQAKCSPAREERPRTTPMVAPAVQSMRARSDGSKVHKNRLTGPAIIIDLDP